MFDPGTENPASLAFVEALFASYLENPSSVPADWRSYFDRTTEGPTRVGPTFKARSVFDPGPSPFRESVPSTRESSNGNGNGHAAPADAAEAARGTTAKALAAQDRVDALVRAYRVRGHMMAQIDPLGLPRSAQPELDPAFYGLGADDMERVFSSRTIFGAQTLELREIIRRLSSTYCRSIGVQFMHIDDLEVKNWLQDRMEGTQNRVRLSREEQLRILVKLTDAVIFEEFIQKKFLGAKSFSLEGSESLIPLLAFAFDRAAEHGVNEVVLGMAHRGRLNVLANIIGKSPRNIFREFDNHDPKTVLRQRRREVPPGHRGRVHLDHR